MKTNTARNMMLMMLMGLTGLVGAVTHADAPPSTTSGTALIDTRLNAAAHAAQQDETVDTRLNFVIHSGVLAKIDTMTKPGTLFLVK